MTLSQHWEDIFGPSGSSVYDYTESRVLDFVHQASLGTIGPLNGFLNDVSYNACCTQYGNEATLICFSDPTFAGTIVVDIVAVPEPAAWVLFIGLAGSVLLWRRDLLGG